MNHSLLQRLRLHARIRKGKWRYRLPYRIPRKPEYLNLASYDVFSAGGEDGLLFHLFDKVALIDGSFIEVGFNPTSALSLNLLVNHDFTGEFYTSDLNDVALCNSVYPRYGWRGVSVKPLDFDSETINQHLNHDVDLLVLNSDANNADYWQGLDIKPRIVVACYRNEPAANDLASAIDLAINKGYQLVGVNDSQTLAFFVRNDLITDQAPTVSLEQVQQNASLF